MNFSRGENGNFINLDFILGKQTDISKKLEMIAKASGREFYPQNRKRDAKTPLAMHHSVLSTGNEKKHLQVSQENNIKRMSLTQNEFEIGEPIVDPNEILQIDLISENQVIKQSDSRSQSPSYVNAEYEGFEDEFQISPKKSAHKSKLSKENIIHKADSINVEDVTQYKIRDSGVKQRIKSKDIKVKKKMTKGDEKPGSIEPYNTPNDNQSQLSNFHQSLYDSKKQVKNWYI